MKKFLTLLLALVMALSIVGCGKTNTDEPQTPDTPDDGADAAVTVMTHAEFDAAAVDSAVTVETYIQARQAGGKRTASAWPPSTPRPMTVRTSCTICPAARRITTPCW